MSTARKRGFAAMDREQQRAIASKGGRAAHRKGTAHEFSSEEARRVGRLGGKAVSANREHMAEIGRKGGQRASRSLRPQPNLRMPENRDSENQVSSPFQTQEYSSAVSETPSAILPHWQALPSKASSSIPEEVPAEKIPAEEVPQDEQAVEPDRAADLSSPAQPSPPSSTNAA